MKKTDIRNVHNSIISMITHSIQEHEKLQPHNDFEKWFIVWLEQAITYIKMSRDTPYED
jgi:hypothetical protein